MNNTQISINVQIMETASFFKLLIYRNRDTYFWGSKEWHYRQHITRLPSTEDASVIRDRAQEIITRFLSSSHAGTINMSIYKQTNQTKKALTDVSITNPNFYKQS